MIVTLIKQDRLFTTFLPNKVMGQYWIKDLDTNGKERNLLSIEANSGNWVARSNKKVTIINASKEILNEVILSDYLFYNLSILGSEEKVSMYVEPVSRESQSFIKIIPIQNGEYRIGRTLESHICFDNNLVSSDHARLYYQDGKWRIVDRDSTNGTFVNQIRISDCELKFGDVIYIMGLKIIIGNGFIAVNMPNNKVKLDGNHFKKMMLKETIVDSDDDETEDIEDNNDYFYRSPRFKRDVQTSHIKVDGPPVATEEQQMPLLLVLGPTITMGITMISSSLIGTINAVSSGGNIKTALPSIIISGIMIFGMITWPILSKRYEKKLKKKQEKKRQKKYKEYIESIREDINKEIELQTQILLENNVIYDDCQNRILEKRSNLWERVNGQNDFLKLNVGLGDKKLDAEISFPPKSFTMTEDNLQDLMYELANEPKQLVQVPLSISLTEQYITGITGNRELAINFIKRLIIQLATLHSYDEVKIVFIGDKQEFKKEWEFIKWLPHIWDNKHQIRYLATDANEVKELSSYFENIIEQRKNANVSATSLSPYYVIIAADKTLFDRAEFIKSILEIEKNIGFSAITMFDQLSSLPKECSLVIDLDEKQSKIYDKNDVTGEVTNFIADCNPCPNIMDLAVALSNISLDLTSQKFNLPNQLNFLQMYNVGKIEHLNSLSRWKENNPTVSLRAPVGVDTMGEDFYLDLHEKFHGPHGLIAGTTGSGKSEYIITYILSLAVNYHPNEVSFILIDYKGGGLAGAFEDSEKGIKLPHLAGTITNLSGTEIKRSLVSIQSELKRRQAVFNEARKITQEGTVDIYKYQKLFREGVVKEPMSHLFIISDEFAELKSQQPDFMDELISAARIGRSLGVHLILATQKPSGVVDDQIWSNSKFKVCLKVQDKNDSMDVLKRPDAAEITQTGRFFLQVGFNELFEMGQSAWAGATYIPSDRPIKVKDDSVRIVDNLGRTIKEAKPTTKSDSQARTPQIVEIVKYLSDIAKEEQVEARSLWLEAIPKLILLHDTANKYNYSSELGILNPVIGEFDDPSRQRQGLLTMSLSNEGNAIVYGATGSGKTTMLSTMLYSLLETQTPEYLNAYILDFGSGTLKFFDKAPQIGDVLLSSDNEKIINLFKFLQEEIDNRKKIFAPYGGDYKSYNKNSKTKIPNILVVIHNFAAFSEMYEEYNDILYVLSREGVKYGIIFVLTVSDTSTIRFKLRQNFKQEFTLQLNDQGDYIDVVGNTNGLFPTATPGRGLVKLDDLYEFQTCKICEDSDELDMIKKLSEELATKYSIRAKSIPILPDNVDYNFVSKLVGNLKNVPIGVNKNSLEIATINIKDKVMTPILASSLDTTGSFTNELIKILEKTDNTKVFAIDTEELLNFKPNVINDDFEQVIQSMIDEIEKRKQQYIDSNSDNKIFDSMNQIVYVISGFDNLIKSLSSDMSNKLKDALKDIKPVFKISFVIIDNSNGLKEYSYDDWYKQYITGIDGIWIGEGIADQYVIKPNKITNDMYKEIGEDFGYLIIKGKAQLLKMLNFIDDEGEIIDE